MKLVLENAGVCNCRYFHKNIERYISLKITITYLHVLLKLGKYFCGRNRSRKKSYICLVTSSEV